MCASVPYLCVDARKRIEASSLGSKATDYFIIGKLIVFEWVWCLRHSPVFHRIYEDKKKFKKKSSFCSVVFVYMCKRKREWELAEEWEKHRSILAVARDTLKDIYIYNFSWPYTERLRWWDFLLYFTSKRGPSPFHQAHIFIYVQWWYIYTRELRAPFTDKTRRLTLAHPNYVTLSFSYLVSVFSFPPPLITYVFFFFIVSLSLHFWVSRFFSVAQSADLLHIYPLFIFSFFLRHI